MANLDRASIVDANFNTYLREGNLPPQRSHTTPQAAGLSRDDYLDLFESQLLSRHLDLQARLLKEKQQGYYTIASSGHEGNAALGKAFLLKDMAFLHYRSGAFVLQRGKQCPQHDGVYAQALSLVASRDDPVAAGRHKVFGSVPLNIPPQTSTIASHLPKAVGTAFSITCAKELKHVGKLSTDSVILCSFGDASLNHSTAQGALNSAHWLVHANYPLPLVFICEDNGYGISVPTPEDWVACNIRSRAGLHYISADGLSLADAYHAAQQAAEIARRKHKPVFLHLKMVRLLGHAGSDIELHYKSEAQIEDVEFDDPLLHSARVVIEQGWLSVEEIIARYESAREEVAKAAQQAITRPKLNSADEVMHTIIPPMRPKQKVQGISVTKRRRVFAEHFNLLKQPRNMAQHINYTLRDILLQYPNALVFGEDVARKGGVYRVTADLMQHFGQRRVFDSILDEQSILGMAIGLAHNGFLPIPEIQFLAYVHNAADQLRGEAATLSFFSNGQYTNPMVVRVASLAYQKGFGGHFHNDNAIAFLREIPGLIIACPSHGADAAKLLRRCMVLAQQEQRVVVFLEPIALYMTKDLHQVGDNGWLDYYPAINEILEFAEVGVWGDSDELALVTYGNGYYLSRQAAHKLAEQGVTVKVIDLRWLAPLPKASLSKAVKGCKRVLIVDECRQTGSLSEELVTWMLEEIQPLPRIKRICAKDSFIPLGDAWRYVVPSLNAIIHAAKALIKQ